MATPAIAQSDQGERIKECEQLLEVSDLVIKKQADTIDMLDEHNKRLTEALDAAKARQAATGVTPWYQQPAVTVPLSFIAGALAFSYATGGR